MLDGPAVRRWAELSVLALTANRAAIDHINVYPVADNDTGTNMLQTMRAAAEAAVSTPLDERPDRVLTALADGALHSARGNSGLLLSQVLRGIAQQSAGRPPVTGELFREALGRADELAGQSVAEPVEGTLLTVLRAAVEACREAVPELPEVVGAATRAAIEALRRTRTQLPVLASAGVVDAGGRGLVILLDSLYAVVCDGQRLAPEAPAVLESDPVSDEVPRHDSRYDYEVMYLLSEASPAAADDLRARLANLGDCVSVAGTGEVGDHDVRATWAVHVHCDDIGAAVESGIELGRVHGIRVTRFADQAADRVSGPPGQRAVSGGREIAEGHVVLAVARGERLERLFREEGALTLPIGERAVPEARELLEAILDTGRRHVLLLPNEESLGGTAEDAAQAALRAGIEVVVVPTASPVQGLAALAVHDPNRRTADDTVALAEAAAATRRGELTVAAGEALTWVGYCRKGDLLGMLDGEVVLIGDDRQRAACLLLDRMLSSGGELVTALIPEHAPAALPDVLAEHLRGTRPEVELVCYPCGESSSELMLGVE
ncbi:DAK2 domain-containing protein [Actinopolyspora erythraea]|uniref:DAK2 domain-containing protein n=1 Tax=Actinopolyspora erythraea TaxID=414996 RepID=UPI001CB79EBB|nr:DAK2 domain-containing protein [Actinopolyspora erythraea]